MNKTIEYISVIIIAIFIMTVGFLIWQGKKSSPIIVYPTPSIGLNPISTAAPNVIVEWTNYTNKILGFSMSVPKIVDSLDRCNGKDHLVPLTVFEDNANGAVYFVPEYYYDNIDNSKTKQSDCVKKVYSLQLIKDELAGKGLDGKYISSLNNPFLGLAIRLKNVKNDTELTKLIKNNYGLGCVAGEKIPWKQQEGVYEVAIAGENPNKEVGISNPDCPVNYAVKILYASEKGKVVYVTLGQESALYGASPDYRDFTGDIIKGFRFE